MKIAGYCPMGCGKTLVRNQDGFVICGDEGCPQPAVMAAVMANPETEHTLILGDGGRFSLQHPLRERVDGELHDCELHRWLVENAAPVEPGRYRVSRHQPDAYSESYRPGEGPWDWEPLADNRIEEVPESIRRRYRDGV